MKTERAGESSVSGTNDMFQLSMDKMPGRHCVYQAGRALAAGGTAASRSPRWGSPPCS